MILTIVLILINNNAFAQNLRDALYFRTLEGIPILPSKLDTNAHINVGKYPIDIATNENFIYVANSDSNDVSVISIENHTKIGENILVGENPTDIAVNSVTSTVYVANSYSDSISVINGTTNEWMKNILVGNTPTAIAIGPHTVYIANSDSDSISVISQRNNSKIGENIPVGNTPTAIAIDYLTHFTPTVYVANSDSDSISVIDGTTNEWMKDILVGENPTDIALGPIRSLTVYVANSDSNDVSVISIENHTKIGENIPVGENPTDIAVDSVKYVIYVANSDSDSISELYSSPINKKVIKGKNTPVGDEPRAIAINEDISTVYVANADSDGISVIDGVSAKVVAGVKLQINPFNSGNIECNGLISPIQQYYYLYSGTSCIAKPNKGFEFLSWEENLKNNASQLINSSHPASTIFEDVDDLFHNTINYFGLDEILNITKPVEPQSILNVNKFGTFTATFNKLPPPLPPEYVATLFGVVVTTLIGSWLTPTIIGWRKAKKHQNNLSDYEKELRELYKDNKLDKKDISKLDRLRENILSGYAKGDLTKEQYDVLLKNISISYNEIFKEQINSLKKINNNDEKIKVLDEIKSDLNDAYSKEKIDKEHYDSLKNEISILYQEIFVTKINEINNISNYDNKIKVLNQTKNNIDEAYSKDKINEKHYNLLIEKISEGETNNRK